MTVEALQAQIQAAKESIDLLRQDLRNGEDKNHAASIAIHNRLNTFASSMQQIEDVKAASNRIAAELVVIKEELRPLAVTRSKVDMHSKVLGFIAAGIGGGLITAVMALILK